MFVHCFYVHAAEKDGEMEMHATATFTHSSSNHWFLCGLLLWAVPVPVWHLKPLALGTCGASDLERSLMWGTFYLREEPARCVYVEPGEDLEELILEGTKLRRP